MGTDVGMGWVGLGCKALGVHVGCACGVWVRMCARAFVFVRVRMQVRATSFFVRDFVASCTHRVALSGDDVSHQHHWDHLTRFEQHLRHSA